MIVNPGKYRSITRDKKKRNHTKETFEIGDKVIEASPSVKLLGVQKLKLLGVQKVPNLYRRIEKHIAQIMFF